MTHIFFRHDSSKGSHDEKTHKEGEGGDGRVLCEIPFDRFSKQKKKVSMRSSPEVSNLSVRSLAKYG
jgi:hypothetical protein